MIEDRKTETPGLAEASAKFEHEAEAPVEDKTSADQALTALWQEHQRLRRQYVEAIKETSLAFVTQRAIT